MPSNWLLAIAVFLEVGFIFWYLILAITFFRSVLRESDENGLTLAMFLLSLSNVLSTIWIIVALFKLPPEHIMIKLPLDGFKAIAVTIFMWHMILRERWEQWRDRE